MRKSGTLKASVSCRRILICTAASALTVLSMSEASAQSSTNVATVAVDAFGEKVGTETIGLYSETQVRGFNLQDSGNYRLDGAYFIRSANIVPAAMSGTTIRVGINAIGIDFPAPSGIVEHRLATPSGIREEVEVGLRDYGGQSFILRGSVANKEGSLGLSYGGDYMNEYGSDGGRRPYRHLAFVPTWRPSEQLQIKAVFSADRYFKPGGDYGVSLIGTELPPPQPNPGKYAPDWARYSQWQLAGGVIARYTPSTAFAVQSSFVVTDFDRSRADFTTWTLGANGIGTASTVRARPNDARSYAAETRAEWNITDDQRVFGTARWRETTSHFKPGVVVPLGAADQDDGVPVIPEPAPLPDVPATVDETRQVMAGVGYEMDVTDWFWIHGAVLKTRYEKDVTPPGLPKQSNVDSPWLYDLAATITPTESLTLFATTVRGLEESGTAPTNAANRNEVLPAVLATQYELGLRYRMSPGLTFISSLFEITKPTPGLDALNVYGLIGNARHRGLELSFVGRPIPSINIVSGAVFLDADRRGALVDSGAVIGRAVGVSAVTGLLNITYQVPLLRGLSIDAQLNYKSKMLLTSRTGVYTPSYATLDLGARYTFAVRDVQATLRARIGNIFDQDEWLANRNETLTRVASRAFRLSLTTNFSH